MEIIGQFSSLSIRNRNKLRSILKPDSVAIIHSNDEMNRSGDQNFKFRQNPNLLYLSGIEQEKTILVLCPDYPDEKMREILFIRKNHKNLEIWEGRKLTLEDAQNISGIKQVRWVDDFESTMAEILLNVNTIYIDIPEHLKYKPETHYRSERFLKKIKVDYPLHKYERLYPLLAELRKVKEPEEIEWMKKASAITKDAFIRVLKTIKAGWFEYEVEAEISYAFIKNGANGHAYAPIIAGGKNACYLHYIKNNALLNNGDLVLMDFGAEFNNYASDLTRTIPVNGKFSPRQLEVYNASLRVFKYARSLMKPGTTIQQIHLEVCKKWEEEHIKLGLYSKEDVEKKKMKTCGLDTICTEHRIFWGWMCMIP
ncbi:MAG: M24 family metallopeptidase, partial [Bacteroidales bacterium]|nr:M24 family metallopeptidase [Bacteroidales bacterium]